MLMDNPVDWLRLPLMAWIDTPKRSPDTLARWLQGYDLPPADVAEAPYLRVLRALPLGNARPRYELELARSAADLVNRIPHPPAVAPPRRADEFVYNLLSLCTGLRARDVLGPPLRRVLELNALGDRSYSALPLNDALRSALIINQADNALEPDWDAMASGRPHPVLRGTPHDGFQGALYMPAAADQHGEAAFSAIGKALAHLALHFTPNAAQRVRLFRSVLHEVMDRYPAYDWNMQMIRYSDEYRWPDWTDVALPSLFVRINHDRFVLWSAVADCVERQFPTEIVACLCDGRVLVIHAHSDATSLIEMAARVFERYRRTSSFGGGKAVIGIHSAAFTELEKALPKAHSAAAGAHTRWVMDALAEHG